jgi:hypothetical protein
LPDEVEFRRVYELARRQQPEQALPALMDFVMTYPDSKYRSDAELEAAEILFDKHDLANALRGYQLLHFPADDNRAWYARYKIAWCKWSLGDRAAAIAEMTAVSHAEATAAGPRTQLIDRARQDLATWQGADLTYVRAEQLYAQQQFCEAAPLFAEVARGNDALDREEAAYAHVLATVSCEHLEKAKPDASAPWKRVLTAVEAYLSNVKPPMVGMRFLHGHILYAEGRFTEAAVDFRKVIDDAPTDETAPFAAVLLLDSDEQAQVDLAADFPRACAIHADDLAEVCRLEGQIMSLHK